METSDKFRGEPVDCCLCLCLPPSRRRRRIAANAVLVAATLVVVVATAVAAVAAASWTPWLKSTPVLAAGARNGGSEINGRGCGCGCSTRRIAGTTVWDNAARPTKEGGPGSDGLLPSVPFFKLLLSAPDGVTGGATSAGMPTRARGRALHEPAPSHRQGQQRSCYDVYGQGVVVEAERECCVVLFFTNSKRRPPNTQPRRIWYKIDLLARQYA